VPGWALAARGLRAAAAAAKRAGVRVLAPRDWVTGVSAWDPRLANPAAPPAAASVASPRANAAIALARRALTKGLADEELDSDDEEAPGRAPWEPSGEDEDEDDRASAD
jgi:hypothetical protein